MSEEQVIKRHRAMRPVEDRIAELDKKIAFHTRAIEQLNTKKAKVLSPQHRNRGLTYAKVFKELRESGKTPEEIHALLNP